jgi:hypothetical protein
MLEKQTLLLQNWSHLSCIHPFCDIFELMMTIQNLVKFEYKPNIEGKKIELKKKNFYLLGHVIKIWKLKKNGEMASFIFFAKILFIIYVKISIYFLGAKTAVNYSPNKNHSCGFVCWGWCVVRWPKLPPKSWYIQVNSALVPNVLGQCFVLGLSPVKTWMLPME